jgi:GNAT superfamily N-acetyltransferase
MIKITVTSKDHVTTFNAKDESGITVGTVYVDTTTRGYGYVHHMFVRESMRRQGIGKLLMSAVIDRFGKVTRLELITAVTLITASFDTFSSEGLGKFYAQYGFSYGPSVLERSPRDSDSRRMYRDVT